jgi:hypothetical protein
VKLISAIFALLTATLSLWATRVEPVWKTQAGPWGELEVRTVYLEAPDTLLAAVAKPNAITRWVFEQTTESAVRELLVRQGVSVTMVERLLEPASRTIQANVISLYPTVAEITSLDVATRSGLYRELAKSSANEYQRDPVYVLGGDPGDWLAGSGLNEAQEKLFRRLVWKRGEVTAFSDIQALLTLAKDAAEVRNTFRALTRVRSLLVELQLPLKGDRQAFLDYWTAGQGDATQASFLRAITQRQAIQSVDITHFFPSAIRQLAYTFPEIAHGSRGRLPDCHWTSLNFFNSTPKDEYLDMRQAATRLVQAYATVEAPYRYGDILCFLEGGEGLHTCVYLADDIVLTKNGDSILAPWVLMQVKDVEAIYRRSPETRIQGFRLKR